MGGWEELGQEGLLGTGGANMERCIEAASPTLSSATPGGPGCLAQAAPRCCRRRSRDPTDVAFSMPLSPMLCLLQKEPPKDVWIAAPRGIAGPEGVRATGRRASPEERLRVERGDVLPGRVVLWGNQSFESRSNEGITAQQEEVRREVSRGMPLWVSPVVRQQPRCMLRESLSKLLRLFLRAAYSFCALSGACPPAAAASPPALDLPLPFAASSAQARAIMEQMQREMEVGDGMDPEEFSIGNSVEDPEPAPGEEVRGAHRGRTLVRGRGREMKTGGGEWHGGERQLQHGMQRLLANKVPTLHLKCSVVA